MIEEKKGVRVTDAKQSSFSTELQLRPSVKHCEATVTPVSKSTLWDDGWGPVSENQQSQPTTSSSSSSSSIWGSLSQATVLDSGEKKPGGVAASSISCFNNIDPLAGATGSILRDGGLQNNASFHANGSDIGQNTSRNERQTPPKLAPPPASASVGRASGTRRGIPPHSRLPKPPPKQPPPLMDLL